MVNFIDESVELDTSGSSEIYENSTSIISIPNYNVVELTPDTQATAYVHNLNDRSERDVDTFYASINPDGQYRIILKPSPATFFESNISIWTYETDDRDLIFSSSGASMYINDYIYSQIFSPTDKDIYFGVNIRQSSYFTTQIGGVNFDKREISNYSIELETINYATTGSVVISGTPQEHSTLTADTSTIADSDGLGAFSYQWYKRPDWYDSGGVKITDATTSSYTLSEDYIGEKLFLRVSYTDGKGREQFIDSALTIVLTNTADTYSGTELPEIIFAKGGDDVVTASKGNDQIDGGDGTDTVIYSGNQDAYTVTLTSSGVQVRDRRPDGNGTDTLTNIEFLEFDTGDFANFNLDQFGGATALNEADFKGFIELYIAYFNRAPDAIGLNFWGTSYANGTTMEQMAELFAPQPETLNTYPEGTSNTEFATAVYNNVLGRTPDQAGFDFWVGVLDAGGVTRDQFILEVLRGVQDGSPDRGYLDNKVDVGAYFAVHKGMSDTGNAAAAMQLYNGTDASIQTVKQAIDAYHLEALDPVNGEFLMPLVGVLDNPFV